jgi:hypothetical protein
VGAPRIELYPTTPWVLRLFDRIPLPVFWVGVTIGLAVFTGFLAYTALLGEAPGRLAGLAFEGAWLAELHQDLFFGFTLAVAAASVRGAFRDLDALRPALLANAPDLASLRREIATYRRPLLLAVAFSTGAIAAVTTPMDATLWAEGRSPGFGHPSAIWLGARNFANWWAIGLAMTLELMLARGFSRLADHLRPLDLLDPAPLALFARRALANVARWMLLAAFFSVLYAGSGWAGSLLPLALAILATFAAAAFLLPMVGAHRRLHAAKAVELARVRPAIQMAREKALGAPDAQGGALADLIAWEQRVLAVREWPIGASTLARFALYVSIGLGSWVGAALVEEIMAHFLG